MSEVVASLGQGKREVPAVAEAHEHVLHGRAGALVSLQQEHVERGAAAAPAVAARRARPVRQESAQRDNRREETTEKPIRDGGIRSRRRRRGRKIGAHRKCAQPTAQIGIFGKVGERAKKSSRTRRGNFAAQDISGGRI